MNLNDLKRRDYLDTIMPDEMSRKLVVADAEIAAIMALGPAGVLQEMSKHFARIKEKVQ